MVCVTPDCGAKQHVRRSVTVFFELGSVATDVVPRGFGADKDVLLDLNTRIPIDGAECHAVDLVLEHPAERCSADGTESQPPTFDGLIRFQIFSASNPTHF